MKKYSEIPIWMDKVGNNDRVIAIISTISELVEHGVTIDSGHTNSPFATLESLGFGAIVVHGLIDPDEMTMCGKLHMEIEENNGRVIENLTPSLVHLGKNPKNEPLQTFEIT